MGDGARFRLAALAVFLLALAMRSLTLFLSPLPLMGDGLHYAAWASDAIAAGRIDLAMHATDNLAFTALVAEVSLVTGVDPWYAAQPATSLVSAVVVLVVVAVTRRVCRVRGWSARRAALAALLGGTFLAVDGLFLHRAMAVDEQTAGLLVVPLALVALHRASRTDRPAWWIAGVVLLAVLPPLHNLDAFVTAGALTLLVAYGVARHPLDRSLGVLGGVTAGFWVAFGGYHVLLERYTGAVIIQEARLTDASGLFVAWLVAAVLVLAWLTRVRARTQRAVGLATFGVMFGLLALNASRAVFPGLPRTPPSVLALLLPLAFPAALAAWGLPDLDSSGGDGPAMLAMGASVLALVGMTLTAALTVVYLGTAYRTSVFLHVPAAVPVGIGAVALLSRRPVARRGALKVGVVALLVVTSVVSVPLAFGGLAPFAQRQVTTPAERASAEFAATHVPGTWAADDPDETVVGALSVPSNVSVAPVYGWLAEGRAPPACPTLVHRSWTTRGTQFVATGVVWLPEREYERWRATRSIVYDGGARDGIHLGVSRRTGQTEC